MKLRANALVPDTEFRKENPWLGLAAGYGAECLRAESHTKLTSRPMINNSPQNN